MGIDNINQLDLAEQILRQNRCRIQTFISNRQVQYVIKKNAMNISPSALSIRDICGWVVTHIKEIEES